MYCSGVCRAHDLNDLILHDSVSGSFYITNDRIFVSKITCGDGIMLTVYVYISLTHGRSPDGIH